MATNLKHQNSTAEKRLELLEQRGEVSHAYIIESEDMAKCAEFAKFAAALVLCTAKDGEKPCGICPSCQKWAQNAHPDIVVLSSAGGKSSFHIAGIRQLRADAFVAANEGYGKVYILEDAQDMTAQAQNALLKLLEEPPAGVKLFLLVKRREMLLATVISRCQIICLGSDVYTVEIPPESITALTQLLAQNKTQFDFFTYFITLRPKRDAALILLNGMRVLAGEMLFYRKTGRSIPEGAEQLPQLAKDISFAAIVNELAKAIDVVEGNANINALFTSLAYSLWSAKNL